MLLTVPVPKPRTFTFLFVVRPYNGMTKRQTFYSSWYEKLESDQFHTFFCLFCSWNILILSLRRTRVRQYYKSKINGLGFGVLVQCLHRLSYKKKLLSDYCGLVQIGWFHFERRIFIFIQLSFQKKISDTEPYKYLLKEQTHSPTKCAPL